MKENIEIPVFGPILDRQYQQRIASYAIILSTGKVGVVQNENNWYFLPGGGIEQNENACDAVIREIYEECGRLAQIEYYIGEAIQYFTCRKGIFYRMHAHFYSCQFTSESLDHAEHEFSWENPAGLRFYHESHRWAVERALERH